MIGFETVRLPDDEAPTTIDRRVRVETQATQLQRDRAAIRVEPRLRALTAHWRFMIGAFVAAVLLGGAFGAFLHERRVSARLRREIVRVEREFETRLAEVTSESVNRAGARTETSDRPVQIVSEIREDLERRGTDALTKNDYAAALTYYQALSRQVPGETVFSDFVQALRSKLRCGIAGNGVVACR